MSEDSVPLLLTTSAAGNLLGVHPSTVKRWSDEGALSTVKTGGGHRRIHLKDVLTAARERGISTFLDQFSPWESNVWLAVNEASGPKGFGRLIGLSLAWLAQGETDLLGRLFFETGSRKEIPFTRFLDECVRGFMVSVGTEWRNGRLQVGEEHMATQVILEALLRLRVDRTTPAPPTRGAVPPKPVAVVGAMEGDHHDLGAQAIRAVLEREGWRVYYLGPNVPVEQFAAVQQAQTATLVGVSFSAENTLPDVQRAVRVLREFYRPRTPYVLALGGMLPEFPAETLGQSPFEALSFSRSAEEFQKWVRQLARTRAPGHPETVA